MLLKYYCAGKDFSTNDFKPYFLNISSANLYENEIVELFCPHCKRKLMRKIRIGKFDGFSQKYDLGGGQVHQAIHDRKDRHYR